MGQCDDRRVSVTVLGEPGKAWPSSPWEGLGKSSGEGAAGLPAQALVEDELGHGRWGVIPVGHAARAAWSHSGGRRQADRLGHRAAIEAHDRDHRRRRRLALRRAARGRAPAGVHSVLRFGSSTFYIRTTTASDAAFGLVRNELKQLDATMPVYEMKTVEGQLDETL